MSHRTSKNTKAADLRIGRSGTRLVLGLDIGTTYVKVAAFRPDGQAVAQAQRAYPTYYPRPGWAEQSPDDWLRAARGCLREAIAELGQEAEAICAIGLSAHAPAMIPVDACGVPLLDRVPIWQDERSAEQAEWLLEAIGPGFVGLGLPRASFAAKLKWFGHAYPGLADRARFAVGVKAFVGHWLTGRFATDPSSEPGNDEQWETVCRACNWSLDRLPPAVEATNRLGQLRQELAEELGLRSPIPVAAGLNDGACTTLGNGACEAGQGVVALSTNGVVFLVTDRMVVPEVRQRRSLFFWPFVSGRSIVGGQNKAGASCLQWLLGILRDGAAGDADYERLLTACAGSPPGSRGVRFLPFLMGRGTPHDDPTATASFVGLTPRAGRGDLGRAVLEGVAFTIRDILEELVRIGAEVRQLRITGGGARSELWRQIISDVLGMSLGYSGADSCLGAAMLAGVAAGVFDTVEAACRSMSRAVAWSEPQRSTVRAYEKLYREFCELRDNTMTRVFPSIGGGDLG